MSKQEEIEFLKRSVKLLEAQVQSLAYKLYDPQGMFPKRHMNLCGDCGAWFPDEFFHMCGVTRKAIVLTAGVGAPDGE